MTNRILKTRNASRRRWLLYNHQWRRIGYHAKLNSMADESAQRFILGG